MEITYKLERKCLHCEKPIPDHIHAIRKFCPRIELEDGSVLNCKDDYHVKKNKPINEPFKNMAKWQKYYFSRIKQLFEKEGSEVTLELINRYGINLFRPFQFELNKQRQFIFYYHQFAIEKLTDKTFKIFKHGLF
jgi:hypothetical protein